MQFPNWLDYPLKSSSLKETWTKIIDNKKPPIGVEEKAVIDQNREQTHPLSENKSPSRKWHNRPEMNEFFFPMLYPSWYGEG